MTRRLRPAHDSAISAGRSRLQSRILVGLALPLLALFAGADIGVAFGGGWPRWLVASAAGSAVFAVLVWRMRAATPAAAFAGALVCLNALERQSAGVSWIATAFPSIAALFVLTFAATRFGRSRKEALGLAEPRRGRAAAQVIANLGIAGWLAGGFAFGWSAACIAALAEAAADTVSSEAGQAFGGTPRMILSGRPVPPGTDGAVSLAGTACGIVAAALVVAVAGFTGFLHGIEAPIAFTAGCAGLFFDSVLGATVERKGWVGNDLVNFLSTAFAAGLCLAVELMLNRR
jgi:uncharacterized protein (TIGR00297 family)